MQTTTQDRNLKSKRDLAAEYHISTKTVYRTLQICGVSTAKRFYTKDEQLLFRIARSLLVQRLSREQITNYFTHYHSLKEAKDNEQNRDAQTPQ